MSEVTLERAGIGTIVVDRGRFGYRHEGVAWCGPADTLAFDVANALLLNDDNAALLEIAYGDVRVKFSDERAFALTGADCNAHLDGRRCSAWAAHVAHAGSVLELRVPARGVFAYLGVSGGIDVPPVLGSRTTDRTGGFGGYHGRALRAGDAIALITPAARLSRAFAVAPPQRRDAVRLWTAPEFESFAIGTRRRLFENEWVIGAASNRMGYRLTGPALEYTGRDVRSHGVFPGTIQVPPAGEPIVLLADAHTTGGYPKAGVVVDADLRLVAQSRPGESLRFVAIASAEEEELTRAARAAYVQAIRARARERYDDAPGRS